MLVDDGVSEIASCWEAHLSESAKPFLSRQRRDRYAWRVWDFGGTVDLLIRQGFRVRGLQYIVSGQASCEYGALLSLGLRV